GAAHHVDEAHLVLAQGVAHLGAYIVVPFHDLMQDFDLHYTSTSRLSTRNSRPERRSSSTLPHAGQAMCRRSISLSCPQARPRTRKGRVTASIFAPSAMVPLASTSRYIWTHSGTMPEKGPMVSRMARMRRALCACAALREMSRMLWVMASSCTGFCLL